MNQPCFQHPTFHIRQMSRIALSTILALLLGGCAAPSQFPAPTAKWRNSIGQLQYVNPKRSVIGDVLVAWQGGRDFQLEFTHGPVPLMKLQIAGDTARVESAVVRIPWQGSAAHAPKPLRSWIALRDVFTQLAAQPPSATRAVLESNEKPAWKAEAAMDAAGPAHLRVEFRETGERFVFHFAR